MPRCRRDREYTMVAVTREQDPKLRSENNSYS